MQAITPAEAQAAISAHDDDFETVATFTTFKAFQYKGDFFEPVRADNFLRAFLSKRTGKIGYQMYQSITYGDDWRRYRSVSYLMPDGPHVAELQQISSEVGACASGLCMHNETVGFDVPEADLRIIADQYRAGASPLWRFKFKAQSGSDWIDDMAPAEVAGLLAAVDAYKAAHPVP